MKPPKYCEHCLVLLQQIQLANKMLIEQNAQIQILERQITNIKMINQQG